MILRRQPSPSTLLRAGCVAMILATLSSRFLAHLTHAPENLTDAVTGFLYGLGMATLMLSVVMRRRQQRPPRP